MLRSPVVRQIDSVRGSKGFLFEAEDTPHPVLCRDVRGFPQAVLAARDSTKASPGRLVVVVPDLAMDDWIARWADDTSRARRNLTITRRTDGTELRLVATLLNYGFGVDTTIAIERLESESRPRPSTPEVVEASPKSGVQPVLGATARAAGPLKRKMAR